jgi:hypothetical protein
MKRRQRLFGLILLWHFGLTIATGLLWNALFNASASHAPAILRLMYASFYLFVPFCQPVFWPLSDWVSHSGHFSMFSGLVWQCDEILIVAFINSLIASALLFSLVWIVSIARSQKRNLPAA